MRFLVDQKPTVYGPGKPEHLLRADELPLLEPRQGDTLAERVRLHQAAQLHVEEQAANAVLPPAAVRCSLVDQIVFTQSKDTGTPDVVTLKRGPDDDFELSFQRKGNLVLTIKNVTDADKRVEVKMELSAITRHEPTHLAKHVGNDPVNVGGFKLVLDRDHPGRLLKGSRRKLTGEDKSAIKHCWQFPRVVILGRGSLDKVVAAACDASAAFTSGAYTTADPCPKRAAKAVRPGVYAEN